MTRPRLRRSLASRPWSPSTRLVGALQVQRRRCEQRVRSPLSPCSISACVLSVVNFKIFVLDFPLPAPLVCSCVSRCVAVFPPELRVVAACLRLRLRQGLEAAATPEEVQRPGCPLLLPPLCVCVMSPAARCPLHQNCYHCYHHRRLPLPVHASCSLHPALEASFIRS